MPLENILEVEFCRMISVSFLRDGLGVHNPYAPKILALPKLGWPPTHPTKDSHRQAGSANLLLKEFKVWRLGILERRYSCPRRCLDNVMLTQTVSLGSLSSWHGCWALGQIDSACSSKLLKSGQIQVKGLNMISWTSYLCASQGILREKMQLTKKSSEKLESQPSLGGT